MAEIETRGPLVLGLDLDGVCADYVAAFRSVVAAELDIDPHTIPELTSWHPYESGWPIANLEDYLALHRSGVINHRMFERMPEIQGASDALWELSDRGVWLRVITHRFLHHGDHAEVARQTIAWLQSPRPDGRPRIPYRDLHFQGTKADVSCDLLIDDAPHNVASVRASRRDVIVFDQPYNQMVKGLRANNWEHAVEIVLSRAVDLGLDVDIDP